MHSIDRSMASRVLSESQVDMKLNKSPVGGEHEFTSIMLDQSNHI